MNLLLFLKYIVHDRANINAYVDVNVNIIANDNVKV